MSKGLERRKAIVSDPIAQFERAVEIREFETQVNALFASGTIRGTTHLCNGQEALAIGLASVLRTDDPVSATYRSHGIALALGLTTESAMSEIMGKATGCCGGLGGSMHLCDLELGLLPTSAIIGGGMPIAAGAALAFQVQGKTTRINVNTSANTVAILSDSPCNQVRIHNGTATEVFIRLSNFVFRNVFH
jgi:pyruvate dehydrogenase E1 component alpha subunit